ncbi:MAG: arginyltransferase [Alphaproteobacteria bacterium]
MRHNPQSNAQFYFTTSPMPCPYFHDRIERRLVTELAGRGAVKLHDTLTHAGFRRSHGISYAPCCPDCNDCRSVRVLSETFRPSRSQRRILNRNAGLTAHPARTLATEEQYVLFAAYQQSRHGGGDMAGMEFSDYQSLVEETCIETELIEFRDADDVLVAACLTDRVSDGLSAVYSFYDPDAEPRLSLGTYMILSLIERTQAMGLPYVYLGFWIRDCAKMSYKSAFRPLEVYAPDGWEIIEG